MATNPVETVSATLKVVTNSQASDAVQSVKAEENLPEVLSGSTSDKKSSTGKIIAYSAVGILGAIAFFRFAPRCFNQLRFLKGRKNFINHLQNIRQNAKNFKEVHIESAEKQIIQKAKYHMNDDLSKALEEIERQGKKLGLSIEGIKDFRDVQRTDMILSTLAEVYNKTKGRIIMPKKICLYDMNPFGDTTAGSIGEDMIMMLARNTAFSRTSLQHRLLHELGHLNHYPRINIAKINERAEVVRIGFSTKTVDEFLNNEQLKKDIAKYVSEYATTSPLEFVADVFADIMRGKNIPEHLMQRYRMYKGPVRLPQIKPDVIFR